MGAETSTSFGALLKSYRLRARLTQEALAEQSGVSVRGIQNLERGGNRPLRDTLTRLTTALELDGPERERFLSEATPARQFPRWRRRYSRPARRATHAPHHVGGPRARASTWTPCCDATICVC